MTPDYVGLYINVTGIPVEVRRCPQTFGYQCRNNVPKVATFWHNIHEYDIRTLIAQGTWCPQALWVAPGL